MSEKISAEDQKLLQQMDQARADSDAPSAYNGDGTLKAPEKAEQDSQDSVRSTGETKAPATEDSDDEKAGDKPKARRGGRRAKDESKDGEDDKSDEDRGEGSPVQFDDDGWNDAPVQARG